MEILWEFMAYRRVMPVCSDATGSLIEDLCIILFAIWFILTISHGELLENHSELTQEISLLISSRL